MDGIIAMETFLFFQSHKAQKEKSNFSLSFYPGAEGVIRFSTEAGEYRLMAMDKISQVHQNIAVTSMPTPAADFPLALGFSVVTMSRKAVAQQEQVNVLFSSSGIECNPMSTTTGKGGIQDCEWISRKGGNVEVFPRYPYLRSHTECSK